jgi:hypothetical protein
VYACGCAQAGWAALPVALALRYVALFGSDFFACL